MCDIDYRDYALCQKVVDALEFRMKMEGMCPVCFGLGINIESIEHDQFCAYKQLREHRGLQNIPVRWEIPTDMNDNNSNDITIEVLDGKQE